MVKNQQNPPDIQVSTTPIPTNTEIITGTISGIPNPTEGLNDGTSTGLEFTPLTQQEIDQSTQKSNLLTRTPLTINGFTVTFDYANDIFIVQLSEPKHINAITFENWRKQNYPALPANRFLLK